jgi:aerobic C4-dicarboxylate transport protein
MQPETEGVATAPKQPFYKILYVQVVFGIAAGVLLGVLARHFADPQATGPNIAVLMKPLGDGFLKLIKMVIGPIIFLTVSLGIAGMRDMKQLGRVGAKAIIYFEVISTLALAIGLVVVNLLKPGAGFNADAASLDASSVASYTEHAPPTLVEFVLAIIPTTPIEAFAKGEILGVLFFAVLFGLALSALGETARPTVAMLENLTQVIFRMVNMIMTLAPIGAFGAMAFTIGKYGIDALLPLARLMGGFYLTCALFVLFVLGGVARLCGFSIVRFLVYIKEELLIVLGTSSSESAMPRLMQKLEALGCSKPVVGLVVPTGYSFNLDGTNIYMTMAAVFIAQATNTHLTLGEQLAILGVAMVSSKGAAGVTGSGFITLAATLAVVPTVPVAGMALILGVDRFMSEARALTNFVGNGVATVAVSRWENVLDREAMARALNPSRE